MKIKVNNRDVVLEGYEKINVKDLLREMRYTFPMIVVKINGTLVRKNDYETTFIKDGDNVSAIHLISGG